MSEPARNEEIEIIEYFDEETNNFLHWNENVDKIYFYRKGLKSKEQNFLDENLYDKFELNETNQWLKTQPGCKSFSEGISLKKNLTKICINHKGIFFIDYVHNHNYYPVWVGTYEDDYVLHEKLQDSGKDGKLGFFVNCDPKFLEYIYNNYEFDCYLEKHFYDEEDKNKFWYSIKNDSIYSSTRFLNWLKEKEQDFYYIENTKKILQVRLEDFNKKQKVDLELLQLIRDLNFQKLKKFLLELEKVYPHLFKRWIFNWRRFRIERNPLCHPSLENLNDISCSLNSLDFNLSNNPIDELILAKSYLTSTTNQTSNINIQEINQFISNSNLFSKPVIIDKDNEIIICNIKDGGTIEHFYYRDKKFVKSFKKHKEVISLYLEEAIKERNFVPFLTSLQVKLQSIRWWQNEELEIFNFFSNCYTYLRYFFIQKYKFSDLLLVNEINAKNASNFCVFLDKNIDKNFNKIYICIAELRKIHPEFFRNPFSILNRSLNINNIEDLDELILMISCFINDKKSSRYLSEILIYINFIKNSVHYLKKSLNNNLDNTDLKDSFKSILPVEDFNIFIETIDEICIKFNINESKIYCSQFFVIYASIPETYKANFISYLKVLSCIYFNDIEDVKIKDSIIEIRYSILELVESTSAEKFEFYFNDFSAKTKTLYNDYFEKKYEEISIKITDYENQINDSKNFIQQYKDALKKFLNMNDKAIDAIDSQISNSETYFNELSNKINQKSKILNDLYNTQNQYQTASNEIQNISNEIKNLKEQLRNKHSDIEKNANELSKKVDELNRSLQEIEKALKFNNNKIEKEKQNIENDKISISELDEKNKEITERCNQHNIALRQLDPIGTKLVKPIKNKFEPIKNKFEPIKNKFEPIKNKFEPIENKSEKQKQSKKSVPTIFAFKNEKKRLLHEGEEIYIKHLNETLNTLKEEIALNESAKQNIKEQSKNSVSKIFAFKDEGKRLLHEKSEIEEQLNIRIPKLNDYKNLMNTREYSLLYNFVNGNSNDNNYNDKPLLNNEHLLNNELNQ